MQGGKQSLAELSPLGQQGAAVPCGLSSTALASENTFPPPLALPGTLLCITDDT